MKTPNNFQNFDTPNKINSIYHTGTSNGLVGLVPVHRVIEQMNQNELEKIMLVLQSTSANNVAYSKVFNELISLASRGYALAEHSLGILYLRDTDVENQKKGIHWLTRAAEQGLLQSQNDLANAYLSGLGNMPDSQKRALEWLELSAANGFPESQYELGVLCLNDNDDRKSHGRAAKLIESAALNGLLEAQFGFANMNERGIGIAVDWDAAFYWMKKAADAGHKDAQLHLVRYYELGIGIDIDVEMAAKYMSLIKDSEGSEENISQYYSNVMN